MKFFYPTIVAAVLTAIVTACGGKSTPVEIRRLDKALEAGRMPTDSGMAEATRTLFMISGYTEPNDSTVSSYASMPSIAAHRQGVDSVFTDLSTEVRALGRVMDGLGNMIPGFNAPAIYTVISPFNQSVIMADSVLFIGLNHYLGVDYETYGYFPDYIRERKTRERLPLDVAEAIVRASIPYSPSSPYPTLLSRMIYEGAVTTAVMRAAEVSAEEALGYSDTQRKWLTDNERAMWDALVTRNLLYSTDPQLIRDLTSLAPFTSTFTNASPGAAGRWIGERIVERYLKNHPDTTLYDIITKGYLNESVFLKEAAY
ncbi:MAG: hypothetical protein NC339_04305 [Muribaculaceae bacterium]|nr:hypothetical protein [Muribaculaceae bacterium]